MARKKKKKEYNYLTAYQGDPGSIWVTLEDVADEVKDMLQAGCDIDDIEVFKCEQIPIHVKVVFDK